MGTQALNEIIGYGELTVGCVFLAGTSVPKKDPCWSMGESGKEEVAKRSCSRLTKFPLPVPFRQVGSTWEGIKEWRSAWEEGEGKGSSGFVSYKLNPF